MCLRDGLGRDDVRDGATAGVIEALGCRPAVQSYTGAGTGIESEAAVDRHQDRGSGGSIRAGATPHMKRGRADGKPYASAAADACAG